MENVDNNFSVVTFLVVLYHPFRLYMGICEMYMSEYSRVRIFVM